MTLPVPMSITMLPKGSRRFTLQEIVPAPWQNGGGLTREIAVGWRAGARDAPGASWTWRTSVADITTPGHFSLLQGIDRTSTLMAGAPVTLRSNDQVLRFRQAGDSHTYPGELPLMASLDAGPSRFFNVMTKRGAACSWSHAFHDDAVLEVSPVAVLLVARGAFKVSWAATTAENFEFRLAADEGLILETAGRLSFKSLAHDSTLLTANIHIPESK